MGGPGDHTPPPGFAGRGGLKLLTTPPPAAGADFSLEVPTGARFQLVGGSATLVTSSHVANRQVYFTVKREGTEVFRVPAASLQAATLTYVYQLLPGVAPGTLIGTYPIVQFPWYLALDERMRLTSVTTNIDTTDQWGPVYLLVEELGPTY